MKKVRKLLLSIFIVVTPFTAFAEKANFEAKVVKVIDGDTVDVLTDANAKVRVRLYGIDAPESKQAFGQKARQALTGAVASKTVMVVDHGQDIYGRLLGSIWLDGYDINASMVDSGYAWVYRFKDDAVVPAYLKFETSAQQASKGLWVDPNPQAPWEWRMDNSTKKTSGRSK